MTRLQMIKNPAWPALIAQVLAGDVRARATLWTQVTSYVEHRFRLPLGPLSSDDELRRDIAVTVLRKLEANAAAHLRAWHDRQAARHDASCWWRFVKVLAKRVAIDAGRTSRRNVARRGHKFEWIDERATDPHTLFETLDGHARPGGDGFHAEP